MNHGDYSSVLIGFYNKLAHILGILVMKLKIAHRLLYMPDTTAVVFGS
jgi:hypothetical protein